MKALCADCFGAVTPSGKASVTCSECGKVYDLGKGSTLFKVRLEGGYVKEGMSRGELIRFIRDGKILPDEYIGEQDGPWITVYDSPFADKLAQKGDNFYKNERGGTMLYERKKLGRFTVITLSVLLLLSLCTNGLLAVLLYIMNTRIHTLISKMTGG